NCCNWVDIQCRRPETQFKIRLIRIDTIDATFAIAQRQRCWGSQNVSFHVRRSKIQVISAFCIEIGSDEGIEILIEYLIISKMSQPESPIAACRIIRHNDSACPAMRMVRKNSKWEPEYRNVGNIEIDRSSKNLIAGDHFHFR